MPNLKSVFDTFSSIRVLVLGDVMIDSYVFGSADRISPEAPVPVVEMKGKESRLGGAANAAANIKAMGSTPILCSVIGNDEKGDLFIELLNKERIDGSRIIKSDDRLTTVKERILSGSHQLLRIDQELKMPLSKEKEDALWSIIENAFHTGIDAVLFEDYDKGVLTKNVICKTVALAKEKSIPTIVDPKKNNFFTYKDVNLFKPNLREIREALNYQFSENLIEEMDFAFEQLQSLMRIESALITLSKGGVYIRRNEEKYHFPAHVRNISDVSGAGDTVASLAALCMALKLPLQFVAQLSNLAGGLVCEASGVVPVDKNRLFEESSKLGIDRIL